MLPLPPHPGPFHSSLLSMKGLGRLSQCGHKSSLDFGVDSGTAVRRGEKVINTNCIEKPDDQSGQKYYNNDGNEKQHATSSNAKTLCIPGSGIVGLKMLEME